MPRKKRKGSDFGERLLSLRKACGLTQVQLAQAIGSTQRAISYYETEGAYPPAPVVADLAHALGVTADELLGRRSLSPKNKEPVDLETRRWWKTFQRVRTLPEKDQRAVVRLINSLVGATERRPRRDARHAARTG